MFLIVFTEFIIYFRNGYQFIFRLFYSYSSTYLDFLIQEFLHNVLDTQYIQQ